MVLLIHLLSTVVLADRWHTRTTPSPACLLLLLEPARLGHLVHAAALSPTLWTSFMATVDLASVERLAWMVLDLAVRISTSAQLVAIGLSLYYRKRESVHIQ